MPNVKRTRGPKRINGSKPIYQGHFGHLVPHNKRAGKRFIPPSLPPSPLTAWGFSLSWNNNKNSSFYSLTSNRLLEQLKTPRRDMNGGDYRRLDRRDLWRSKKQKLVRSAEEELESKLGFDLFTEGEKRLGWLLTFASVVRPLHHIHQLNQMKLTFLTITYTKKDLIILNCSHLWRIRMQEKYIVASIFTLFLR